MLDAGSKTEQVLTAWGMPVSVDSMKDGSVIEFSKLGERLKLIFNRSEDDCKVRFVFDWVDSDSGINHLSGTGSVNTIFSLISDLDLVRIGLS